MRRLLADDDLQTIAVAYAEHLRSLESEASDVSAQGFEDFFRWIIEHQDEIIAFIEKLLALFDAVAMDPPNSASRVHPS